MILESINAYNGLWNDLKPENNEEKNFKQKIWCKLVINGLLINTIKADVETQGKWIIMEKVNEIGKRTRGILFINHLKLKT